MRRHTGVVPGQASHALGGVRVPVTGTYRSTPLDSPAVLDTALHHLDRSRHPGRLLGRLRCWFLRRELQDGLDEVRDVVGVDDVVVRVERLPVALAPRLTSFSN